MVTLELKVSCHDDVLRIEVGHFLMFLKVEANEVHFFGIGQPAGDLLPSTAHKLLFH